MKKKKGLVHSAPKTRRKKRAASPAPKKRAPAPQSYRHTTARKPKAKAPPPTPPPKEKPLSGRQEKFCLLYVQGKTQIESYREVYGPSKGAEASASRLLSNAKVRARCEALRKEAAAGAVLSLQESLVYLRRAVLTPVGSISEHSDLCQSYERNEMGGTRGKLKRGHAQQGNEEEEPEYEVVKIRITDKLKALELNARLQGWLKGGEIKIEAGDELTEFLADIRAGR